jgi:transcriptional regulator with XRE-family HTH domain
MSRFGAQLKQLRARRNVCVREVAIRSGVSHSTISLIERDRVSPSVDTLAAILNALDSTLADFFSELQSTSASCPSIAQPNSATPRKTPTA